MDDIKLLQRKLNREIAARKQAETILEKKAMELHNANEALLRLNESLEQKIEKRTAELEQSEKRYRQIVESATDFIFRADPDGYFTYVNPIASQKLGFTTEELIGSHFTDYVLPGYKEQFMERYISLRDSRRLDSYEELPIVSKNGDVIWIGQNVQFVIKDGIVKEATGFARDISERKITEDILLTTQLRLTSLITNLQTGVLVEDETRKVVLANKLFCDLLKIPATPKEMKGMDCELSAIRSKHLFKEPDLFVSRIDELLIQKEIVIGEEIHTAEGKILERDYIPIWGSKKYLGHLWQYRDITEKYLAEEKLRRSEEKYRGIIENMELGLMEVDVNHQIVKAYDGFCEMTGYSGAELVGKNAVEIFLPEQSRQQMESQEAKRKEGEAGVYEVQLRKKDGSLIWVLISGAPIFEAGGKITGSIGIHYDITNQKKLQHDLEKAKQVAEDAERAEQQFLARMSHEIRTPLHAIIGMSHLLEDTILSNEQKDFVDALQSSSNILQKLISDILDLSKVTAGGMEVNPKAFDLVGSIRSLQKTFQLKLGGGPVSMEVEIDPRIQTLMIGDDLLLNQILLNLLGNAIKFTEKGIIFLKVEIIALHEKEILLEFTVQDTGIGIPPDRTKAVFENFKQADNNIRFHFGGTGLGLPITKQLVELQGGEIQLQSQLGKGTTFTFRLPYLDSKEAILAPDRKDEEEKEQLLSPVSVLIAEDNFMNRKYIGALCKKWKIKYEFATNGNLAIEAAKRQKFDIIFMDISMPELNGYDATIKIRNIANPNQQTPIIALTASAMLTKKDKAFAVGMSDYLAKPFRPNQLKKMITHHADSQTEKKREIEEEDVFTFNKALDSAHLNNLYKGDFDYAAEMFEIFLGYTLSEYKKIRTFFKEDKMEDLQLLAHKIKPNFSLVGLTSIEQQMLNLENLAAAKGNRKKIGNLIDLIDHAVGEARSIIAADLNKMKILI